MGFNNLIVKKDKQAGWIIINRPDKLNALNEETMSELHAAFLQYQDDPEVRVIILTGTGEKAFVAGADIGELSQLDRDKGEFYSRKGQALTRLIEHSKKPVIAAVNGFALGGGTELALACHIRVASENAKLGQPEVKLGLIPGFGGTQRLARLVGKGKALEMILTGDMISAQEAFQAGLVNKVVPLHELIPSCERLAESIIANSPLAAGFALEAVQKGMDMNLDEGLSLEARFFGMACGTGDAKEGTAAFLQKRKASFKGE